MAVLSMGYPVCQQHILGRLLSCQTDLGLYILDHRFLSGTYCLYQASIDLKQNTDTLTVGLVSELQFH